MDLFSFVYVVKLRLVLEYLGFLFTIYTESSVSVRSKQCGCGSGSDYASPDLRLHCLSWFLMELFRFTLVNLGLYDSI